jgi:D-3-phosphoglycerate dehydrogenase / 2-oxoglutarate reductase
LYGFWCERPMPPEHEPLLQDVARNVGSGIIGASNAEAEAFFNRATEVHVIIASSLTQFNSAFFARTPALRVVARTGIGIDNITLDDATAYGVAIINTPDAPSVSTAEHAILLMLATTKRLRRVINALVDGERRNFFTDHDATELEGLQLGVVGLGRIGRRVSVYGAGLGMKVKGYDPFIPAEQIAQMGIEAATDLEDLLRTSDVVSLHVPATAETNRLMNAERFAMMKPDAYLVNTARGSLVDESALLHALESGSLRGAGLDVFDPEPPDPSNPLLHHPGVIATPHVGGVTIAGRNRLWSEAIVQTLQVLRGEHPPNLCNPDVWPTIAGGR